MQYLQNEGAFPRLSPPLRICDIYSSTFISDKQGGKYIFGWSRIRVNGELIFPRMAIDEYKLKEEKYIYIVSGSKQTGGFSVMTEPLLSNSKLKNILIDNPYLVDRSIGEGELISYKGRKYAWLTLKDDTISLPENLMKSLGIEVGDEIKVIADSFDEYLEKLMEYGLDFISEDTIY